MIINIPLRNPDVSEGLTKRAFLKFIDVNDEEYNVLLVIEENKGKGWEQGEVHILGFAQKLDMKRLGKAS